jgi:hypothetical protein
MGITLIITKAYDKKCNETGKSISLEEWADFVEQDNELRIRTEDWHGTNPATGETITVPPGIGESVLLVGTDEAPFLSFRSGDLVIKYTSELGDPQHPIRTKIAEIAKHFEALITDDAGGGFLDW